MSGVDLVSAHQYSACTIGKEGEREAGADKGIYSGGCEILKRENYTKKGRIPFY